MSNETKGLELLAFSFLSDALKNNGLPFSKPTIIRYEKLGVIKPGINSVIRKRRIDRYYTKQEIGENIRSLKEYIGRHHSLQSRKK